MAAALIYWKRENLLTRSDMGANEDALKAITYKINSAFKGYEHRLDYLEKAIKVLGVEDCTDFKRRKGQKGTVVVVSGKGDHKIGNYIVYKTSVYRGMELTKYKELKSKDNLPDPDFKSYLTRDAHMSLKSSDRSDKRYGNLNETPPGDKYYMVSKVDSSPNKNKPEGRFDMYIADTKNGRIIKGVDGERGGIAIHHNDINGSQGCLTFASGNGNKGTNTLGKIPVKEFYNEIPELFVHNQLDGKTRIGSDNKTYDMSIDRRYVRVILEERKVVEKTTTNDKIYWEGILEK